MSHPLTPVSPKCPQSSQGRWQSPLPARHREKERRFRVELCFPRLPGWHAARQHDARPNSLRFLGQHPPLVIPPSPPAACAGLQPSSPRAHDGSILGDLHPMSPRHSAWLAPSKTSRYLGFMLMLPRIGPFPKCTLVLPLLPSSACSSTHG